MGTENQKHSEPFKAFDLDWKFVAAGTTRKQARERAQACGIWTPIVLRIIVVRRQKTDVSTNDDGSQTDEQSSSGRSRE